MTLPEQIKLVNALIRENRDVRICDYLEVVQEIEGIELPAEKPKPKTHTPSQELFILEHHASFTASEISAALHVEIKTVRELAKQHRVAFKPPKEKKHIPVYGKKNRLGFIPDKVKPKIIRPTAEYDNLKSNYA